ncbi:MAG: lipopolysaccharide heptosyltransferase II [Candidatus Omnitrophica bacterium]|nr:lipopolysaccharide heptosyltransferase II [Candidatus Omnitrophota bacterium]
MDMKRILIIEPNWLGDILFTTPSLRALKKTYPSAFIVVMAHPRCAQMLEDNPCIDKLILFDERPIFAGFFRKILFIRELRKMEFDTVISFHRSMSKLLIACLSGIPRRLGYYTRKRSWLLTDPVAEDKKPLHRVEYFLKILKKAGISGDNKDYEFHIPDNIIRDTAAVMFDAGLDRNENYFVVNPGGNWDQKRWPPDKYSALCRKLHETYKLKILITGAQKDVPLARLITGSAGKSAIDICGKTTLKQLACIMRYSRLVIAGDTGPMHIAISQKAPVIALFGPTCPDITGPYGAGRYRVLRKWHDCALPCYKLCPAAMCMDAISVDDVFEAAEDLLLSDGKLA